MKLTTPVNIPESSLKINHLNELLLLGSCFSQNIGRKLEESKFNICNNSFGTVYNPISIAQNLNRLKDNQLYKDRNTYNYKNEKLVNFSNQNSLPITDKEEFLNLENDKLAKDIKAFKEVKTIVLTFGTAQVYERCDTNEAVANCHKIPSTFFNNRLLSVSEIVEMYEPIITQLADRNFVFTVSPVRHIKGGLYQNNLSKSTLHLAINELVKNHDNCYYFPAYEIVIDELRDYRFYKEDMVHPSDQAVNYIWNKFSETYFNTETIVLNAEILKVKNASTHKPFNHKSKQHQEFIQSQLNVIMKLQDQYSFLDFGEEKKRLTQQE